jgi:hypothetical protein
VMRPASFTGIDTGPDARSSGSTGIAWQ